jgi:prepilin-type N-terminal cleavage/methylation domain-containing protein
MRRDESGFTLVELLVSLTLLSLMTIYALNALSITSQMKIVARGVERKAEVVAVMQQFHDEIASLTPAYAQGSDGQPVLMFEGEEDTISYVISADGTRETGGLYRVIWRVDSEQQLIVERSLLRVGLTSVTSLVALKDVLGIKFGYEAARNWKQQHKLPKAIWLRLEKIDNKNSAVEILVTIASGL